MRSRLTWNCSIGSFFVTTLMALSKAMHLSYSLFLLIAFWMSEIYGAKSLLSCTAISQNERMISSTMF